MTYLKDIHGLIIGGLQNFVIDECVHDYNGNLIQLVEKLPEKRELHSLNLTIQNYSMIVQIFIF